MPATAETPHLHRRWRLFWTSLPIGVALTALKLVLDQALGFKGLLEFNSDLNVIFTALVFIMGFLLAGTITDFKEAERLPGEIACQLEIMEDWFVEASVIAARTPGYPADGPTRRELLGAVRDSSHATLAWLRSTDKRSEDIFPAVKRLDEQIKRMEQAGLDKITVRMLGDVNQLRRGVTRAYTIARTEFMGSAYALLEFFLAFVFLLLLACSFRTPVVAAVVTSFLSVTYWYLYRLIRDIDNPFDFGQGHTEVSLQPLERYWCASTSAWSRSSPREFGISRKTACGRICLHRKRVNLSHVFAGQRVGIKEVDEGIWIVSFMHYDLGYIDLEQKTLQPLDNPFGPRLSPMC